MFHGRSCLVPLDHTGATAGTLPLTYAKVPATGTRTGTIVLLAGGPGQSRSMSRRTPPSCSRMSATATTS